MQSLTVDATKMLVQAVISSRIDYCNAVLHGITDNLLRQLQSVQNANARPVTHTGGCKHIPPVLPVHWLPVQHRVEFKIDTLMFKALNGLAPPYMADDCKLVSNDIRRLHSAVSFTCWFHGHRHGSAIEQ